MLIARLWLARRGHEWSPGCDLPTLGQLSRVANRMAGNGWEAVHVRSDRRCRGPQASATRRCAGEVPDDWFDEVGVIVSLDDEPPVAEQPWCAGQPPRLASGVGLRLRTVAAGWLVAQPRSKLRRFGSQPPDFLR